MKWIADENFRNAIVRGLLRRSPRFDIVRVQDIPEISGQDDPVVLLWATEQKRVVLTHDLSTMLPAMRQIERQNSRCAPIVLVLDSLPVALVIDEVLLLDECAPTPTGLQASCICRSPEETLDNRSARRSGTSNVPSI